MRTVMAIGVSLLIGTSGAAANGGFQGVYTCQATQSVGLEVNPSTKTWAVVQPKEPYKLTLALTHAPNENFRERYALTIMIGDDDAWRQCYHAYKFDNYFLITRSSEFSKLACVLGDGLFKWNLDNQRFELHLMGTYTQGKDDGHFLEAYPSHIRVGECKKIIDLPPSQN